MRHPAPATSTLHHRPGGMEDTCTCWLLMSNPLRLAFKQKGSSFLSFCQDSSPQVNGNHNAWQKLASAPPGNVPRVTTLSSISCLVQ
ncbi:hypothetical protein NC652_006821 [Populus alba x Populus x berolinensis]|nr:hypothetical protein NC652_006821 [Populus alba x Populus x berolinensis]